MNKNYKHLMQTMLAFGFVMLVFSGGCDDAKPLFTEKQLAQIPYAKTDNLPPVSGGFVLAVNGETITSDEVVSPLAEIYKDHIKGVGLEEFKAGARANVEAFVTNKMFDILLYLEAKKELGENDDALDNAVETEVRKFVIDLGNDTAKAEAELKKKGQNWDTFRQEKKKDILSQSYLASQMPTSEPITYGQMLEVYNQIKEKEFKTEARLQIRLIDIQMAKLQQSDPNINPQQEAREIADSLLERIDNEEDFGELAKRYSHDSKRSQGGLWEPVNPDSLASPYDVLVTEAEKMEVGQISGLIEAEGHVFIMMLEQKQPATIEPFENVQKSVESRIRFNRQLIVRKEITDKLMSKATIGNKDDFVDFCLDEIYRKSKTEN